MNELTLEQISEQANEYAKLRALAMSIKDGFDFEFKVKCRSIDGLDKVEHQDFARAGKEFTVRVLMDMSLLSGKLHVEPVAFKGVMCTATKGRKAETHINYWLNEDKLVKLPLVAKMSQFFRDYRLCRMPEKTLQACQLLASRQV